MYRRYTLLIPTLLALLVGCEKQDSLATIQAQGELVVVSRNSPTTYYMEKNGPAGFEYALTEMLAQELGVELVVEPAFSIKGLFRQLQRGEADLAAAGLALTDRRGAKYPHSVPYNKFVPQVVYVAGTFRPRKIEDLPGMKLLVLAGSSHADTLRMLQQEGNHELEWQEVAKVDTMELLQRVNSGNAALAVIGSNEFEVGQSLYPRLKVAFDLGVAQDMVWYLPPDSDNTRLLAHINAFIERLKKDGTLERQQELHFGHIVGVSRIGSHTFTRNMHKILPGYRALIKQVANEYQMDWHLLAAIAYQESHWNPRATSPTGVKGMMMLTLPTARELGVDNRLDVSQSLRGGARYLKNIKRRLPDDILEPDRTWLALAAYNIGMGHMEDGRVLTQSQGGNPDLWREVMARLPLLQKRKFYENTRYGFSRGQEAVTYVQNIRHYYSILQWQDIPDNKALPPIQIDEDYPAVMRDIRLLAL